MASWKPTWICVRQSRDIIAGGSQTLCSPSIHRGLGKSTQTINALKINGTGLTVGSTTAGNQLLVLGSSTSGAGPLQTTLAANILVTGTSGAGKSFAVSYLLSAYEVACAGRGDRPPFTFILDNGASYRRYIELRPDARYVAYDFEHPPGVQPFLWNEDDEALDEHVSRLEWLLLDLLHVSEAEPERFERKKATIEAALYKIYRDGLDRDFKGFAEALQSIPEGKQFITSLFPFTGGGGASCFTSLQ